MTAPHLNLDPLPWRWPDQIRQHSVAVSFYLGVGLWRVLHSVLSEAERREVRPVLRSALRRRVSAGVRADVVADVTWTLCLVILMLAPLGLPLVAIATHGSLPAGAWAYLWGLGATLLGYAAGTIAVGLALVVARPFGRAHRLVLVACLVAGWWALGVGLPQFWRVSAIVATAFVWLVAGGWLIADVGRWWLANAYGYWLGRHLDERVVLTMTSLMAAAARWDGTGQDERRWYARRIEPIAAGVEASQEPLEDEFDDERVAETWARSFTGALYAEQCPVLLDGVPPSHRVGSLGRLLMAFVRRGWVLLEGGRYDLRPARFHPLRALWATLSIARIDRRVARRHGWFPDKAPATHARGT